MITNPIYTIENSGLKWSNNKLLNIPSNVYSLTISTSTSGTASSDCTIGTENYQTKLYATPSAGCQLSGWNVTGGSVQDNIFTFGNTDATIEPIFEEYVGPEVVLMPDGKYWTKNDLSIDDDGEGIWKFTDISNSMTGDYYYYLYSAACRVISGIQGYRMATTADWMNLKTYFESESDFQNSVKSTYGWGPSYVGQNTCGTNILPVGNKNYTSNNLQYVGTRVIYWCYDNLPDTSRHHTFNFYNNNTTNTATEWSNTTYPFAFPVRMIRE